MAKTSAYYLDEENIEWIKQKAEQDKRSASDWLNILLEKIREQDSERRHADTERESEQ